MSARGLAARIAVVLALAGGACDEAERTPAETGLELRRAVANAGRFELHAPEGPLRARAEVLAARIAAETPFDAGASDRSGFEAEPRAPRIVLGTVDDDDVLRLAGPLGLERLAGGGFGLLGRAFERPGDLVVATFEDPDRPGWPLVLAVGIDAAATAAMLDGLPSPWRPHLLAWRGGEPDFAVPLATRGAPLAEHLVDRAARRAELLAEAVLEEPAPGLRILRLPGAVTPPGLVEARNRAAAWLDAEPPPLEVVLWPDPIVLEEVTGRAALAWTSPLGGRVHAAPMAGGPAGPGGDGQTAAAVARATALGIAGPPAAGWMLDGLGAAVADRWWGRPLEAWCAHVERAGRGVPFAELVADPALARYDAHVITPLRGLLFAILVREIGPSELARTWASGGTLDDRTIARFERSLARLVEDEGAEGDGPRALGTALRGVALDGGPGLADGLARGTLRASLKRARELGARSFSIALRAAPRPGATSGALVAPTPDAPAWGSVSDAALAHAVGTGRELGLRAVVTVQVLAAPWAGYVDDTAYARGTERASAFDTVERVARHYALLGELLGLDVLALAGIDELSASVSEGAPHPERRRESLRRWRELLAGVRLAFGGALVYAADARREAGRIGFWDELDGIGLLLFPRLEEPLDEDGLAQALGRELRRARELGRRWERPVVLVQVGYPARSEAWADAAVPLGADDPAAQEHFHAALARALERAEPDGPLRGLFLWGWPADLARAGPYAAVGRPAEAYLPRILGR